MASKNTQNQPEGFRKLKNKPKKRFGSGEFENKIEKKVKKVKAGPKKFGSGEFENKITKTRKLGSGEFNDTSKKITKKATQNQPEGSGAPKKILGSGEFADTSKKVNKTTKNTKTDKKVKKTTTSKISPRGLAFRAARKANKKVFEFPKGSGKMFTTNLKGEDKKVVKKKNEVTAKTKEKRVRGPKVNVPGKMKGGPPPKKATTKKLSFLDKIMKETRRNFGPGRNKLVSKGTSNIIDNKNFVSDKKKKK